MSSCDRIIEGDIAYLPVKVLKVREDGVVELVVPECFSIIASFLTDTNDQLAISTPDTLSTEKDIRYPHQPLSAELRKFDLQNVRKKGRLFPF